MRGCSACWRATGGVCGCTSADVQNVHHHSITATCLDLSLSLHQSTHRLDLTCEETTFARHCSTYCNWCTDCCNTPKQCPGPWWHNSPQSTAESLLETMWTRKRMWHWSCTGQKKPMCHRSGWGYKKKRTMTSSQQPSQPSLRRAPRIEEVYRFAPHSSKRASVDRQERVDVACLAGRSRYNKEIQALTLVATIGHSALHARGDCRPQGIHHDSQLNAHDRCAQAERSFIWKPFILLFYRRKLSMDFVEGLITSSGKATTTLSSARACEIY